MRTRQRAAVMFLTTLTVTAYTAARSWTFDKDTVGKIAPGWNQAADLRLIERWIRQGARR